MATATQLSPGALLTAAKAVIEAYNTKDWKRVKSSITPDFEYDELATGRRMTGVDATIEAWQGWARAFPDSVGTIRREYATREGLAVLELTWTGTHKGTLEGPTGAVAATGKSIEIPACAIFEFTGERARVQRHYFDMVTMLRQIGVME